MGLTSRWFWLDEHDEAHRIAARKWYRIVAGDDRVPAFARQQVTMVEAIVDVDGRDVIAVVRLTGWRHDFDERGYVDRERIRAGVRLALESLEWGAPWGQPANVRSLEPGIARRRLAQEFRVTLRAPQRESVLRAIWKW